MAIREGANIQRTLKEHHVIVAAHRGRVGYIRVEDVRESGGPTYEWKWVYDANWTELGFLDQFGNAYKYHFYSPAEQAQQNRDLRLTRLPSDSPEANVLRILGIDPSTDDATFPRATRADITGDTGVHIAGPGIVPAKAPAEAAK